MLLSFWLLAFIYFNFDPWQADLNFWLLSFYFYLSCLVHFWLFAFDFFRSFLTFYNITLILLAFRGFGFSLSTFCSFYLTALRIFAIRLFVFWLLANLAFCLLSFWLLVFWLFVHSPFVFWLLVFWLLVVESKKPSDFFFTQEKIHKTTTANKHLCCEKWSASLWTLSPSKTGT